MIKCICKYCGKSFETYLSEIKRGRGKYCCHAHYRKYMEEHGLKKGSNNPLYQKQSWLTLICKQCKQSYQRRKSELPIGRHSNFCSRKCRSEWISKEKSGKNSWHWIDKVKCVCKTCGKEFDKQRCDVDRGNGVYCSKSCQGIGMERENNPNWNNGTSFEPYCPLWNNEFRERVRLFFGNRCVICQKHKDELGYRLIVHHVLYDKQVCCKENEPVGNRLFVSLCRGHHAASNSNRDYWAQLFTEIIHMQYGGKCFFTKNEAKMAQATA